MRLWRKRDSVEGPESEAAAPMPAPEAAAVDEPAPVGGPAPADEPAPVGGPALADEPARVDEPAPVDEPALADEPAPADDPALPGTAGYRHRKPGDTMPARFTFVRPDGQPEPKKRRGWLRG